MTNLILKKILKDFNNRDTLLLKIKSRPNSAQTKIVSKLDDETIKIDISAERDKGKANQELIRFLAKNLNIKKENIKIISGKTTQKKLIKCQKNK